MGNTILNIRFGTRHLQVLRFGDWKSAIQNGRSPITFNHNPYQALAKQSSDWKWFELYR